MLEEPDEEKGLFTFYKQQELQDQLARLRIKNRGKKNKKSKRRIKSHIKSIENSVFVITEDNEEEQHMATKEPLQHFLRNIRNRSPDLKPNTEKPLSNRLKTDPAADLSKKRDESVRSIKKTKILSELSQKYNFLPPKEFSPLSQASFSPISDIVNACQQRFYREYLPQRGAEYEQQKKKLLERLRSLEVKNKSNLISSRESINLRESKERPESENKSFFNHVVYNAQEDGLKVVKDALKLPTIKRDANKTEVSPNSSVKKLVIAAKNMPYQRKQLRLKHSNQRRREFYKLNLAAELTESKSNAEGPTINFIDLSKDYKESFSQEWQLKRKLIKSRLGVQL